MDNSKELAHQLYLEVKSHFPDFKERFYDTSGTIYYGQTSRFFGMNGNGFKLYRNGKYFYLGVKDNLKTGKLDDHTFLLPDQFSKARVAVLNLYELPVTSTVTTGVQETYVKAVESFKKALVSNSLQLDESKNAQGTTIRFISSYNQQYAPAVISLNPDDKSKMILRVKKYAPLDCEKNKDSDGNNEYDLLKASNTNFIGPIEKLCVLFETIELYNNVLSSDAFAMMNELLKSYSYKIIDIYGSDICVFVTLTKGYKFKILKTKGNIVLRINGLHVFSSQKDFVFDIDGVCDGINYLLGIKGTAPSDFVNLSEKNISLFVGESTKLEYKASGHVTFDTNNPNVVSIKGNDIYALNDGECVLVAKCGKAKDECQINIQRKPEEKPAHQLSSKAQYFVDQIDSLPSSATKEDYELLFELYDELEESDCEETKVNEAYELIKSLYADEDIVPNTVRFVYASKAFLKTISELQSEYVEPIENIKKALNSLKRNDLNSYLVSKQLVYIEGYLKIRVKNGSKHRIIFCFGNTIGKNPKDLYLFEYNQTHNFTNLPNLHPEQQQYVLWSIDKAKASVPPLTPKQEAISTSVDKPLICTGCAGSGKTLISVYMYIHLLDKEYGGDASIASQDLVYVTYNENARDNAVNQIKEVVDTANAKTIFEFFYDIAKPDLAKMKYVDETDFFDWWKNGITDYQFKNKMNSLSSTTPERYVYTFFRGLFKGSMFRWQLEPKDKYLTKEQFFELMSKEPVGEENTKLIYEICKLYQKHLEKNNFYDDNDLARFAAIRLEKGLATKHKHIIVDEVQDLTEVQLDAVLKSSIDKRKLYFFGDQNQSINPTLFNLDFIEMCLRKNGGSISSNDIYKLNSSFRFGPLLAKYINKLIGLKQEWIGTLSQEETESSNKNPEKNRWAGKVFDESISDELLRRASNSANAIIIVPDNKVKKELEDKYGPEFTKRVTTIYDSKGLEWDYVVLYNMLSFNQNHFNDMVNGRAKHSTLHRMIFNQYYVGCTRALTCFTVVEKSLDSVIKTNILNDLQNVSSATLNLYIQEENDPASWYKEALRLFDAGIYDLSLSAFEKAGVSLSEEPKMDVCRLLLDPKFKQDCSKAEECKKLGFYKEASKIYLNANKPRLAKLMNLYSGINVSDDDAWDIVQNENLDSSDMEIINKNGFLTKKNKELLMKMNKMLDSLKG